MNRKTSMFAQAFYFFYTFHNSIHAVKIDDSLKQLRTYLKTTRIYSFCQMSRATWKGVYDHAQIAQNAQIYIHF